MSRSLLAILSLFFGLVITGPVLHADEDAMLRAEIEPGRDLWVEAPVPLRIRFTGVEAKNLAHLAPGSLRIRLDGTDLTDAFLFLAAARGGVKVSAGGRTVEFSLRIPLPPGRHEVEVRYTTVLGGGPVFRQAFTVFDRDRIRKDLGLPPRRGRTPPLRPFQAQLPPLRPSAPPVDLVPEDKAFIHSAAADLKIVWSRGGAGLRLGAYRFLLDGVDRTANFTIYRDYALWSKAPLSNGKHTLVAQVADQAGNLTVQSATFLVFDGSKRKPWFFAPTNRPHPVAHTHHQFQWYSGGLSSAYFHHGVDIREPVGSKVYVSEGGRITNFYWYGRRPYYFEIEITDADGYRWQYHHVDRNTVPASIAQIAAKKGSIARGTLIGANVYWPARAYGALFHHIHLNVLGPDGRYVNPLNLLLPITDTKAPTISRIYITRNASSTVLNPRGASGATVGGKLDFVAQAQDLVGTQPYQLTIYRMTWQLRELTGNGTHNVPETDLWKFDFLPGGGNRNAHVWDIFRYRLVDGFTSLYTRGNYSSRVFYYVLTNRVGSSVNDTAGYFDSGARGLDGKLLYPNGTYRLTVKAYDIRGNTGTASITLNLKN